MHDRATVVVAAALIGCLAACDGNQDGGLVGYTGVPIVVYVNENNQAIDSVPAGGIAYLEVSIDDNSGGTVVIGHVEKPNEGNENLLEDRCHLIEVPVGSVERVEVRTLGGTRGGDIETWAMELEGGEKSNKAELKIEGEEE